MISILRNIQFKWRLRRYLSGTRTQPRDWNSVKKIALVLKKTSDLNKSEIDSFIHSTGKYVEVFYIETSSKKPSFADWHCFTAEQKNLLGLPAKNTLSGLTGTQFDLVINTCEKDDWFAGLVSAAIPSALLCASNNNFTAAHLAISRKNTSGIVPYLRGVLRYLQMIRVQPL